MILIVIITVESIFSNFRKISYRTNISLIILLHKHFAIILFTVYSFVEVFIAIKSFGIVKILLNREKHNRLPVNANCAINTNCVSSGWGNSRDLRSSACLAYFFFFFFISLLLLIFIIVFPSSPFLSPSSSSSFLHHPLLSSLLFLSLLTSLSIFIYRAKNKFVINRTIYIELLLIRSFINLTSL